jgi:hypothetical protein
MSGSTSGGNVIGSGSDSIVLQMSEDQSQGVDAQFTVNVDGQQIGGLQTVYASHSAGQDEQFTFLGNYAPGQHNVTVTFYNNFQYPGSGGDRNLYVDGVSYDGQTVSNSTTGIYQSPLFPPNSTQGDVFGNAVYSVNDTTAIPAGAGANPTTTPGPVSIGSGPDTIVLNMAEDPYQGDAQFTVSVDGQQIGGTQTTTAVVSEGQQQEFDVHGNFGGGNHTVTVNYTNDQVGGYYPNGTPGVPDGGALDTADRNLYVMSVSDNGGPNASGAPWELDSSGSHSFTVTAGNNQNVGSASGSSSSTTTDTSATASTSGSDTTAAATTGGSNSTTPTSDTATISSDSLGTGSSGTGTGISFVSPPTDSGTSTATSSDSGSGSGSSTDTASSTVASSGGQSTQDFTTPSTGSGTTTDTGSVATGGGHHHWWGQDQGGHWAAWRAAHSG